MSSSRATIEIITDHKKNEEQKISQVSEPGLYKITNSDNYVLVIKENDVLYYINTANLCLPNYWEKCYNGHFYVTKMPGSLDGINIKIRLK